MDGFDLQSHPGVIVVLNHDCADTSLTLAQKLERGHVHEDTGPEMLSSENDIGRSILSKTSLVRSITALGVLRIRYKNNHPTCRA